MGLVVVGVFDVVRVVFELGLGGDVVLVDVGLENR